MKAIALALAALIVAWAPGPFAYQAVAAEFEAPQEIALPAAPLAPETVALPGQGTLGLTAPAALSVPQLPATLIPNAAPAGAQASASASPLQALQVAGQALAKAKTDDQTRAAIENLFTGNATAIPDSAGAVLAAPSAGLPALSAFSLDDLKDVAGDSRYSPDARAAAVRRIADRSDDPARLALREIGSYDANATAADYEVKRQALRALKAQTRDQTISLPAIGEPHKRELLANLSKSKPQAAVFDYHGTWEAPTSKASPETASALAAVAGAGVETMLLTGGHSEANARGKDTIFEQLSTLTPAQKAGLSVGSDLGSEIWTFDKAGQPQLLERTGVEDKAAGVSFLLNRRETFERLRDAKRFLPAFLAKLAAPLLEKLPSRPIAAARTVVVGDHFLAPHAEDAAMLQGAPGATALSVGGLADPDLDNVFVMPTRGHAATLEIARAIAAPRVKTPEELAQDRREEMDVKATVGWGIQRTISIIVFVLVSLSYPLIAQQYLGGAGLSALMALGPLASIATGPLNGKIVNMMTMRNGMALNAVLRAVLLLDMPTFLFFHIANFWTLALGAIANGWLLSAIMATENAYMKSFGGKKNIGTIFALSQINYLTIQVVLNLIIGVGSYIDHWNHVAPATAFVIASVAHVVLVFPIVWNTIRNVHIDYRETGEQEPQGDTFLKLVARLAGAPLRVARRVFQSAAAGSLKGALSRLVAAVKGYRLKREHVALALAAAAFIAANLVPSAAVTAALPALLGHAALGLHAVLHSPILLTSAILFWVARGTDSRALFKEPKLRVSVLLVMLGVAMLYPIQYVSLPMIALAVGGAAGKALLLSRLLGALFFGQLIAFASHVKLPELRLPFIGRFGAEQLVQKSVIALAATWVATSLMPHNLAAIAAAMGAGYLLTKVSAKVSDRGGVKFVGLGLLAGLGLMAVGFHFAALQIPLQFLGLLTMGVAYGLGYQVLNKYQQSNAGKIPMGTVAGVNGSFLNSGISLGYGAFSLLALVWAFPALFVPLAVFFAVGAAFFFLAPGRMPGLPKNLFVTKEKK